MCVRAREFGHVAKIHVLIQIYVRSITFGKYQSGRDDLRCDMKTALLTPIKQNIYRLESPRLRFAN